MVKKNRNNHIYVLDDLRGIAIIAVIFYHYFFVYYRNIEVKNIFIQNFKLFNNSLNLGAFGVSLFFLVSGFVIPMSLKGKTKKTIIRNFAIRRFFRLYPTYWFAIILISTIILLFKDSNAYSTKQILINFTMLQDILKIKNIDGVFWTLTVELKFYILTAFLFYFSMLKKINLIIMFFLFLSILTMLNYDNLFNSIIDAILHRNYLWSYIMLMYLGTAFYFFNIKEISRNNLLILILIISIYFFSNQYFLPAGEYGNRLGYSVATLLSILTFTLLIKYKKMISPVTTFFGNISYSLYLLHQILGYFLITLLLKLNIYFPFSQFIAILIMVLITIFANRYIEVPSNKIGHKYAQ